LNDSVTTTQSGPELVDRGTEADEVVFDELLGDVRDH
jgi:hypothetical protein